MIVRDGRAARRGPRGELLARRLDCARRAARRERGDARRLPPLPAPARDPAAARDRRRDLRPPRRGRLRGRADARALRGAGARRTRGRPRPRRRAVRALGLEPGRVGCSSRGDTGGRRVPRDHCGHGRHSRRADAPLHAAPARARGLRAGGRGARARAAAGSGGLGARRGACARPRRRRRRAVVRRGPPPSHAFRRRGQARVDRGDGLRPASRLRRRPRARARVLRRARLDVARRGERGGVAAGDRDVGRRPGRRARLTLPDGSLAPLYEQTLVDWLS